LQYFAEYDLVQGVENFLIKKMVERVGRGKGALAGLCENFLHDSRCICCTSLPPVHLSVLHTKIILYARLYFILYTILYLKVCFIL
jgi:sulfur relay (sulfurtransferase) DsrC/TusE family protein